MCVLEVHAHTNTLFSDTKANERLLINVHAAKGKELQLICSLLSAHRHIILIITELCDTYQLLDNHAPLRKSRLFIRENAPTLADGGDQAS